MSVTDFFMSTIRIGRRRHGPGTSPTLPTRWLAGVAAGPGSADMTVRVWEGLGERPAGVGAGRAHGRSLGDAPAAMVTVGGDSLSANGGVWRNACVEPLWKYAPPMDSEPFGTDYCSRGGYL